MERIEGMPRYRCHKEVEAAKIEAVNPKKKESKLVAVIELNLPGGVVVEVDAAFMAKHDPKPGMYLVQYADGYLSVSPAQAFEEGYALIEEYRLDLENLNPDEMKLWKSLCPGIRYPDTADRVFNVLCEDGMVAAVKLVGELNDEYRLKGAVTA